jgi:hypothetical protein
MVVSFSALFHTEAIGDAAIAMDSIEGEEDLNPVKRFQFAWQRSNANAFLPLSNYKIKHLCAAN